MKVETKLLNVMSIEGEPLVTDEDKVVNVSELFTDFLAFTNSSNRLVVAYRKENIGYISTSETTVSVEIPDEIPIEK